MPNKTIYISPDNEEAWEQFKVQNGSINNFLSTSSISPSVSVRGMKIEPDGFKLPPEQEPPKEDPGWAGPLPRSKKKL